MCIRDRHIRYEKNPFVTWKAMVFNLISSLFGVLFLAITCALYPIYAFAIPRQVWTFLGEKGFGILYYIFANSNVLRYFHLRSIAKKHENDNGDESSEILIREHHVPRNQINLYTKRSSVTERY